jgi:hypothetical protein
MLALAGTARLLFAATLLGAPTRLPYQPRLHTVPRACAFEPSTASSGQTVADAPPAASRLFIGGIPFGMTEAEVRRLFDGVALPHEVSPIVEVCLVTSRDGMPRGFGFVQLATAVQAERATALLDGRAVSYGGRMPTTLVVRPANQPSTHRPREAPIAGRILWVGNVSFGQRPKALRNVFAYAAGVDPATVWCHLPTDDSTHRSKGYGTVRFAERAGAARALRAMRGAVVSGRTLLVQYDHRAGGEPEGGLLDASGADASGDESSSKESCTAADAIDPELLAEVESALIRKESASRRADEETRRQQEIACAPVPRSPPGPARLSGLPQAAH